jgi:two-component system cell cycle sensor histidine kinase/response regulator CckA
MAGLVAPESADAERFQRAFDGAADAMILVDDHRRVLQLNAAAAALLAVPLEHPASDTLDGLLGTAAPGLDALWNELLALGEARREQRVTLDHHNVRLIEWTFRARVQGGDRHLCIVRDLTDRRLLEERLLQSEKVESVGRLAGGIAHDFNNLLTAMLGYTELLLRHHSGEDDSDRTDLEEIQKAGLRAAALTQQLLAYSRKQVLQPKEVDLNRAVSDFKTMLSRLIREDITLTCELAPTEALVKIDPVQLEQVILNLVLNARDALPSGGIIRLEVAKLAGAAVAVPPEHTLRAAEYVRLRVADNGVGIAPDIRPHVFEPFFTTKGVGKGTGLGLASVYGIVRQSHGFISVESEPGHGTVFTMHFPAVACAIGAEADAPRLAEGDRGTETILLVEDEDAVRVVVATVLRRHGYTVLEASDARIACEIFDRDGAGVDLLLTDVVMPGMNGPALAQRLVAARQELRVLFISGYSELALPLGGGASHVSFLRKPFSASALAARVRQMLTPVAPFPGSHEVDDEARCI